MTSKHWYGAALFAALLSLGAALGPGLARAEDKPSVIRVANPGVGIGGRPVVAYGAWSLVRASNTGPILVLRFEAPSPERLSAIQKDVESVVREARTAAGG